MNQPKPIQLSLVQQEQAQFVSLAQAPKGNFRSVASCCLFVITTRSSNDDDNKMTAKEKDKAGAVM